MSPLPHLSSSLSPLPLSLPPSPQLTTVKAQCVYLRAFYQLCHHEILNALDNFFDTLQRLEVSLVPDYKYVNIIQKFNNSMYIHVSQTIDGKSIGVTKLCERIKYNVKIITL